MKTKTSLIKLLKIWGVIFLTGIGASIIFLDIFTSYHDFHSRAQRLRADYIAQQKQLIRQEVDRVIAMIDHEKKRTEAVTRETIQARVNEAYAIALHIYEQHKDSRDKAKIQPLILEALRPIRFAAGTGYYFIIRPDGFVLLNANKPELEKKTLLDLRDTHDKYFIKKMTKIAGQSGEGFCEYRWVKPNTEGNNFKKISFIKRFKPLDWIIGTGLYVDDVWEQMKTDLLSSISRIRFGKEGYIFVNRLNGDALVSNGKHFSGTKKLWQVFNEHPEKMKEIFAKELAAAQRALEQARSLTNQLLTFAKGGSPALEPQDIRQVIAETAAFNLAGSNVKLVTSFAPDTWNVLADKGQISQVVANLVLNADQAMPDGGRLEISTANVVLAADEDPMLSPGAYVRITVQDQGVGIPKAYQEKIFDPYFTTRQTGSGLGLATVYSIVRKHQGHIRLASTPNQGTIFTIHLPADTSDETLELQEDSQTNATQAEFSQPWKIMVMDDDETICELAVEMLALLGCTAETANDGREAISRYREAMATGKAFDLVIMDLTVPGGMGGEEAVRKLLDIDPGARVVVSSGYSAGRVMAHYRDFGFIEKLSKPYNMEELRQLLVKLSAAQ